MVEWLCAHREMCDVLAKREWKWRLHGLREGKGDVGWDRQRYLFETGEAGLGALNPKLE